MHVIEEHLLGTGHRRRPLVKVVGAMVDLMLLQDSDSKEIRALAQAMLSLLLRETASLRKEQGDFDRAVGRRPAVEREKAFAVAAARLGVPQHRFEEELCRVPYSEVRRLVKELQRVRRRALRDQSSIEPPEASAEPELPQELDFGDLKELGIEPL